MLGDPRLRADYDSKRGMGSSSSYTSSSRRAQASGPGQQGFGPFSDAFRGGAGKSRKWTGKDGSEYYYYEYTDNGNYERSHRKDRDFYERESQRQQAQQQYQEARRQEQQRRYANFGSGNPYVDDVGERWKELLNSILRDKERVNKFTIQAVAGLCGLFLLILLFGGRGMYDGVDPETERYMVRHPEVPRPGGPRDI